MIDEKKNITAEYPIEARPVHGFLFVLACLALIVCLLILSVMGGMMLTYAPGDLEQAVMGEIGVMMGDLAAGFIVLMLRGIFRPVWLVGLLLSGALAVRRRNKPRWMWVTSLCMVGTLILIAAVMLLMM